MVLIKVTRIHVISTNILGLSEGYAQVLHANDK